MNRRHFSSYFRYILFGLMSLPFLNLNAAEICQDLFFDAYVFLKPAPEDFVSQFGVRSRDTVMAKKKETFYTKDSIYRGDVVEGPLTLERAIDFVMSFQRSTLGNGIDPLNFNIQKEFSKLNFSQSSFNSVRRKYVSHLIGESNLYFKSGYTSWTTDVTIATGFAHPYFMNYFDTPPDIGFATLIKAQKPVTGLVADRAMHELKILDPKWKDEKEVTIPVGIDPEMIEQVTLWELKKTDQSVGAFEGYLFPKKAIRISKLSYNLYMVEMGEISMTTYQNLIPDFKPISTKNLVLHEDGTYQFFN